MKVTEQMQLALVVNQTPMPARVTVVLTYWNGRVVSDWPDLNIRSASYPTWPDAIRSVLHPLNLDKVIVKVRA